MANRNHVTADLKISAKAQLENSRSFINQLDKIIDKFDFGNKINNQLVNAKNQLKDYNKILEKVQNKSLISDNELKDLVKAGKEIANIVSKTEKLYINLSSSELQKFSKEYINKVKAQEEAIAKIKNEYAAKTGKNFDKELANYDKLSAKVKALEKEKSNLAKNGVEALVTKQIEQTNQKLEEQKNKLIEIRKLQQDSANAYSSTVDIESKKRGYGSYNDIKNVKIQSEDQIRKQLGNAEYKKQSNIISEINKEIKNIEKNKQDSNSLDKAAVELARKYKIENVSTLDSLKQQIKLKKDNLNTYKNNKSDLANEKLVTVELEKQNKILEDRNAIEKAGKAAELTVIQQGGYTSKASLTASASATNRSITTLGGQLTESGIENITNTATQTIAGRLDKIAAEIENGNQDLSTIDETNKKLATQSERAADEQDIKTMTHEVDTSIDNTEKEVNKYTNNDNSRIAAQIAQEFNREKIEEYKNKINNGLDYLTNKNFNDAEIIDANKQLVSVSVEKLFNQIDESISGKNNLNELSNNINEIVKLSQELEEAFAEELSARRGISAREIEAYELQLNNKNISTQAKNKIEQSILQEQTNLKKDEKSLLPAIGSSIKMGDTFNNILSILGTNNKGFKEHSDEALILSKNIKKAAEQSSFLASTFDDFKNKVGYFLSLNYVFDQLTRKIKEASDFTQNLDKDMTQIGLVLGQTSNQTWKNFNTYAQMADRLNTTVSNVTASMKLFYQQGLNTVEVNKMVEASAIAAALGESTMAEASETLTSIINSYNLSANQAIEVTDKISMVAMVSAADFGEISTAIEKVASSAASAGLDLDHMMGYLAKMIETTREAPTNIGTALKTIVANFTQFKEDPSGLTEEGTEINKVDKALKSVGISLTSTNGEVRDLSEVLDELGKKWNGLTRNQKSYLATAIAGTRQQSRFYALMNDYDRTLELVEESTNSDGKATEQFALYQDSLTASTERLNNEWEKFYNNILKNDSGLKILKNGLSALLKIANKIGPTLTTIFGMGLLGGTRKVFTQISNIRDEIKKLNQDILSTEKINKKILSGQNVLEGYNFNNRQNNKKGLNKRTNDFGNSIAQRLFSKNGGNEQAEKLKELQNLQKIVEEGDKKLISANKELIESTLNVTLSEEELNGTISNTTRTKMASTVQTQAETVAHTASASVKWAEVAAQVALNLAIMAGIAAIGLFVGWIIKQANAEHEATIAAQEKAKASKEEAQNVEELINSYKELSEKTILTNDEKQQLSDTISNLIEQYPELIDSIDAEGNAYLVANSKLEKFLANKQLEAELDKEDAANKLLKDKKTKDNAFKDKNIFAWGASKNKDNFLSASLEDSSKSLQTAIDNLKNFTHETTKTGFFSQPKKVKEKDYEKTAKIIEEKIANGKIDEAIQIVQKRKKKNNWGYSQEEQTQIEGLLEKTELRLTQYKNSLQSSYADVAKNKYGATVTRYAQDNNFSDEQSNIAQGLLQNYYKEQMNNYSSGEEMKNAIKDGKLKDGVDSILEQVALLTNDEIEDYNKLISEYKTNNISLDELKNNLDNYSGAIKELAKKYIKEAEDEINDMANFNIDGYDNNTKEEVKKKRTENLSSVNGKTRKLLASTKSNFKEGSDFTKEQFNEAYVNALSNKDFLIALQNLDSTSMAEIENFKAKYAESLGIYGEKFLNELIKNPKYDAQKTSETLNSAMSIATGEGTTISGSSMSDVISGQSQEGAFNILSSEDETRAQNLLILGNKLVVSAEEINSSYKKAFEDISNYTTQVTEEAQGKIDNNVNKIRDTLNNQNWKIGDKIDFSSLTDAEKDTIKTSQKAISNLQKQIDTAEELRKKYSQLSVEQQANVDYAPFRNGIIATQNMVNELSNLADIYDVVTNKEYTQLDLVNWIANDTSGQLLTALEIENGQLALNANSMEYLAEARKQEAIAAIDAQINKLEGQLEYLNGVDECTESELEEIKSIDDAHNKLTENFATNTSTSSQNLLTWVTNWSSAAKGLGKTINSLIKKFNELFKAEKEGNGDTGEVQTGGANIDTDTNKNEDKIDIESKKKIIQDNIDKLKKLRDYLKKTSGKKLLEGINNIGSYGGSGSGSKDKFNEAIEKLEHFYNYLRQLENIEAKLNKIREKRNLIDADKNYYIDDLKEENKLLQEQQKIYNAYIADETDYLKTLRDELKSQFGKWVSFTGEGVVQVKQTEFKITSEKEQEKYQNFSELLQEYQNEYNTREENKNKLYEIENTQLENIKTMYDKILSRVTDITDELNRQQDLLDHDMTMQFGSIAQFDIMNEKMANAVKGIKTTMGYLNDFENQIKNLNTEVKNGPFKELLIWDEALEIWRVNEEKLQSNSIVKKYEKLGYTFSDIEVYVHSIATKSQSIREAWKETEDSANSFAEALKSLIDDRINLIQDYYSAATDELNKLFDSFDRKINNIDNENNLFGTVTESLEDKYLTLTTATVVLKQTIQQLNDNKASILQRIQDEYPEYIKLVNGVAVINKQAIQEATDLTAEERAELLLLYGVFESANDQVIEMEDKLVDYFNKMLEMEEAKRDAIINLKQQVHDELMARDQQEIDDLQAKYDKMSQLDNEYYSKLSQKINDARQLRSQRQEGQSIAQTQAKLATLKADNSGAYNAQIIELQKQLNQQLQDQADNDIDRELERIEREQKQREEDRQLTISAMENVLTFKDENNWYWQEAQRIWNEGPESVTGFLRSSREYMNISDEQRALEFENLTNSMNTAFSILQTAAGESDRISDGVVSNKSDEQQEKLDNVNNNLSFIQSQITEEAKELLGKIDWTNAQSFEKLDKLDNTINGVPITIKDNLDNLYRNEIKPGTEGIKEKIKEYLGANSDIWNKLGLVDTSINKVDFNIANGFTKTIDEISTAKTTIANGIKEATKQYYDWNKKFFTYIDEQYAKTHATKPSTSTSVSTGSKPATGSSNKNSSSGSGSKGSSSSTKGPSLALGSAIKVKAGRTWYYTTNGAVPSGDTTGYANRTLYIVNSTNGKYPYAVGTQKGKVSSALGWVKKTDIVGYKTGGYVDYTGVANVHGSKTKPEAFLNAKQTQLFEALRDGLMRKVNTQNYSRDDKENSKEEYNIDNVNIEVKELADTDSVGKITKKIKEEIYKDATGRNNMAIRRR